MLKISEKIFVIAMLFYATGAILPFFFETDGVPTPNEPNPVLFAVQFGFYAIAFWFIAIHWRTVLDGALRVKWILCLSLIAVCSTAWSQDPELTARRSIVLVATTAFGIYFGSRFTVPQQLRLLAWTSTLVVISSFAIAIFLPHYGVDHFYHRGDWQGAFHQKNMLGRSMVLAALVFHFVRSSLGRTLRWAGIAGALILLVLSRSLTGAIALMAILGAMVLCGIIRARLKVAIPMVVTVALVGMTSTALFFIFQDKVFQILHRGSNLSGRTELWGAVTRAIMIHPLLGYGFDAFWKGMEGESATIWLTVHWIVLHSHCGFLDLLLNLGALGLAVFVIGYVDLWWRAVRLLRDTPGSVPVWLCAYLAFMFFYNLSESSILAEDNIFWILYTAAAVRLFVDFGAHRSLPEAIPEYAS
jgi:O-antigen ligase